MSAAFPDDPAWAFGAGWMRQVTGTLADHTRRLSRIEAGLEDHSGRLSRQVTDTLAALQALRGIQGDLDRIESAVSVMLGQGSEHSRTLGVLSEAVGEILRKLPETPQETDP